jgi:hypothetical protein
MTTLVPCLISALRKGVLCLVPAFCWSGPGGTPDADDELLRFRRLLTAHCYLERRSHRPLDVVFMRPRIAELGQHPVAHEFGDKSVIARDDAGNGVLIGPDLLAQFLEVEPRR